MSNAGNIEEAEEFRRYLEGELSAEEALKMESRFERDPAYAERFEAFASREAATPGVPSHEVPDLRNDIRKRIRKRSQGKFFSEPGMKPLLGTLALVVVLIGLVLFLVMGPFGLMTSEEVSDEEAVEQIDAPEEQEQGESGAVQEPADEADEDSVETNADREEQALDRLRSGESLAEPGRVSGRMRGPVGTIYAIAYRADISRSREETRSELIQLLPDDAVIETDEGFEFQASRADAANLLARLSEFGAEVDDFRRETEPTERNLVFFRVVLQ